MRGKRGFGDICRYNCWQKIFIVFKAKPVVRGKYICPNFSMEQVSDFKLSTKLSVIYHNQMDIIVQATTK